MSCLLDHARNELKLAGYDIDAPDKDSFESDEDYGNECAKNAYKMLEVFSSAGHSGFSAGATLALFNKLAEFKCLTPLTNNPDEWMDTSEYQGEPAGTHFQSKRQGSCFSDDGLKTYYDIDEEVNKEYDLDEKGKRTGWVHMKPREEWVHHKLEDYKK
jgi:hypothetical protein